MVEDTFSGSDEIRSARPLEHVQTVTFDEPLNVYKVVLASKLSEAQNTPRTPKG